MIPYTAKFLSNGAVIDSVGRKNEKYISVYNTADTIYYLKDVTGSVESLNIKTESISSFKAVMPVVNTEVYSVVEWQGNVYAFAGYNAEPFDDTSVLYIQDNTKLVVESYDRSVKATLLSSYTGIRDFLINDDMSYFVIHNTNNISKFSRERNFIYTIAVSSIDNTSNDKIELLSIDYVREYSDQGLREYPIVVGTSLSGTFFGKIDEKTHTIHSTVLIPISRPYYKFGDVRKFNTKLTNYSFLRRTYKKTIPDNTLIFKLKLINIYNNRDVVVAEMPFNVSKFSSGYHHISFRIDAVKGFLCLFVDGKEVNRVSIPAGQYIFQDITQESLGVGATYFYNNVPLFKQLKQNNFYFIDNCKIKQFRIYNKALSDNEIRFLTYNGTDIEDLVVNFPCDQRVGLDQIDRQFTLNVSGHKSNSVNIIIKNSNITNPALQTYIKDVVVEKLKTVLPATTKIVDITFNDIDYTPTLSQ